MSNIKLCHKCMFTPTHNYVCMTCILYVKKRTVWYYAVCLPLETLLGANIKYFFWSLKEEYFLIYYCCVTLTVHSVEAIKNLFIDTPLLLIVAWRYIAFSDSWSISINIDHRRFVSSKTSKKIEESLEIYNDFCILRIIIIKSLLNVTSHSTSYRQTGMMIRSACLYNTAFNKKKQCLCILLEIY